MSDDVQQEIERSIRRLEGELARLEALAGSDPSRRSGIMASLCQLQFSIDLLRRAQVANP